MANENRLIDASELIEEINDAISNIAYTSPYQNDIATMVSGMERVLDMVEDAPTVDAVEVVHGYWEKIEDDYFDLVNLKCSVCGEEWCFEDYDDCLPQNYHYCPNCGAKMDGERRTE